MRLSELKPDTKNNTFMMLLTEETEISNQCHMEHSEVFQTIDILNLIAY